MNEPICDRCEHLMSSHDRRTKYTDHACAKRDKRMARLHEDTKEGTINKLAGSLIICICDGFVEATEGVGAFSRELAELRAQKENA